MGLAEFLKQGVQGAMGIQPTIENKRKEAEQLGQAMVNAGQVQSNATINAANTRAEGQNKLGKALVSSVGNVANSYATNEQAKKKSISDADALAQKQEHEKELARIKFNYDKELLTMKETGSISQKQEDKLRDALNQVSDDWSKNVLDTKKGDLGTAGLADAYKNITNRIKDTKLQDTSFAKGLEDQFVAEVTANGVSEDIYKHPLLKDKNSELYKKVKTADLEKQVYDKKFGGNWLGWGKQSPNEEHIVSAFKDYLLANNKKQATTQDYMTFLEQVAAGDLDIAIKGA